MATCGACGKKGLKKTTMALVIERGRTKGKRIGECCARDGVLIVPTRIAPVVVREERKPQQEVLRPFVEALEGRLRARAAVKPLDDEDAKMFAGYALATEDVIAMLKSGRA